jgi:recombination associated protein RdgC
VDGPRQRLLLVDAGSVARADEVTTLLTQAIPGLMLHLLQSAESPGRLHGRLADGRRHARGLPDRARVRAQVSDEQKSVVRYARHALDIDEVRAHLTSGKMPTRLALSWKERVAFTLTETLTLKKISFLDLAFEGRPEVSGDESFDADLALATGELGTLIPALIEGLGGEHDFTAAALGTSASPATAPAVPAALPAIADAVVDDTPPW